MTSRILVVDDDEQIRHSLDRLLRADGMEVKLTSDGVAGLREFATWDPDLVLLDVVMPQLDGFEVCRQLKSDPATRLTPVVMLTGLTTTEDRIRGIDAGADDFLSKPFERAELLARVRSLLRIKGYVDELDRVESVLCALAQSIEGRDPYTGGHCQRLSRYAVLLGEALGLPDPQLLALERAGVLHDIGKVAVSDTILLKRGPLSPEEIRLMRRHPVVGEAICRDLRSLRPVLPLIRHHHEKMDGSGYPDALVGEAIPLAARVLAVVDVYDALTTERPYKGAYTAIDAIAKLEQEAAKGWWDRSVVSAFKEIILGNEFIGSIDPDWSHCA